ncbi:hypothetical protein [Nocardioides coralli]|uniref:hypothetical protein n=1 Tax=Nocardioides coralli TaxID=2872154 RepID=UPI001CA3E483|nr:hypothetical protein [Nocardioides coralli]QZY29510.1 hypothetical protein K6T13_02085 [Nocardioides coralli]
MSLPDAWTGLVDDAAVFPPGDVPLPDAVNAHVARRSDWYADLVGSFVVTDERIPDIDQPLRLSVVVTGGAGAIAGALRLAARGGHELAGVEIALRDLDDLAGNARRVTTALDTALAEGLLAEDVPAYVELPAVPQESAWLAAADAVAEGGHRLKFRTGGLDAHLFPGSATLAAWIDAALDRETPFKCTAGLHNAVAHTADDGFDHHGFLNVLLATLRAFDGATTEQVVAILDDRDPRSLTDAAAGEELARGRRWFTSFGSCSVSEPLDDLLALGLLEKP